MSTTLETCAWPMSRLGEAVEALARASGLNPSAAAIPPPPHDPGNRNASTLSRWFDGAGRALGLEVEPCVERYENLEGFLRSTGAALLRVSVEGENRFLSLVAGGRRRVQLLGPDLTLRRFSPEAVRAMLTAGLEAPLRPAVDRLLDQAGVGGSRCSAARVAVLREHLTGTEIGGIWQLGLPPGADFRNQLSRAGVQRRLVLLTAVDAIQYLLWLLSWWMIGRGALQGRLDRGWLLAWALLLMTLVPLRLLITWWQGVLSICTGGLLKRRLLDGMLRSDPESIRHQGAGQLLGRVLEAEAVESLALSGGFTALVAVLELALAVAVLSLSEGGGLHAALLAPWLALTVLVGWRYLTLRRAWTQTRLDMTHELVERMAGHRTRLAQEPPEAWHEGEDQGLLRYLRESRSLDRLTSYLTVLVPRGWLTLGLAALAPIFVFGKGVPAALAVGIGGILIGYRGLERLTAGISQLAGAAIAWRQVAPFFRAAADPRDDPPARAAVSQEAGWREAANGQLLVEGHELAFRYRDRSEPVLRGCSLRMRVGDRILLEGPSGGGKSTLASLITGLRRPESGLLLLNGLDRHTLGPTGWRRRVAAAPQYHENHVLTSTLAFNLLMSRRWPPESHDMEEAEGLCRELGLGPLLERMPGGLLQMVGETGWQLSHGERSRLFIARALLQGAELVVLDESFAALDPENLTRALRCTLARARTLLVIAHP